MNDLGNQKLLCALRVHQSQMLSLDSSKKEKCMGTFFALTGKCTNLNVNIQFTQMQTWLAYAPNLETCLQNQIKQRK